MSEQITNTGEAGNPTPQEGKTFSQEDVNRIVSERLAREKSKPDADLAQREQDLQRREFLLSAKETLTARGLSHDLLDALNTSTPETFNKSLDILEASIKKMAEGTVAAERAANPHRKLDIPPAGRLPGEDKTAAIRAAMGLK